METVLFYGCYDFNESWYLIEMMLNVSAKDIEWDQFVVPDENLDKDSWQTAYLEQYLDKDGSAKICELYDEPEDDIKPCRIAFFIFKTSAESLRTPYGDYSLTTPSEMPERLKSVIEFEDDD